MAQDLRLLQLGQVCRDVFLDFGADLRIQLLNELMVDFLARGQQPAFGLSPLRQGVESAGKLPDETPPHFQLDVVPLTVRHNAPPVVPGAAGKSPPQIAHFIPNSPMGFRIIEHFNQFQVGRSIGLIILQFISFETSKIRNDNQCVFHTLVPGQL
ncbi:hypothetical protein SBV1_2540023 [Verrucomicrobia bacterium]|nr:hypothetical protein SBV1_2540023 [Verrucomicrobiota bacterium]